MMTRMTYMKFIIQDIFIVKIEMKMIFILGPSRRGKLKKRRLNVVVDNMRANGLTIKDAEDRVKWKKNVRKLG